MFKKIVHTFSSSLAFSFANTLFNYFSARILGPTLMGIWQTARIVPNYSGFLSLGTAFYFTREVPKLRGKGEIERIEIIRQTIFTYNYIITIVTITGIIIYTFLFEIENNLKLSLYSIVIIVFVSTFTSLNEFLLKGESRFLEISKIRYLTIPFILVNLLLLFWLGFTGFLIGQILLNTINAIYYFTIKRYPLKFSFDFKIWKDSVRVGFPISVEVMIDLIFTTVDRLIIVTFLGFTQVGYYSLTSLLVVPISLFVTSINNVLFVETLNSSSRENNKKLIERNFKLPSNTLTYVLPFIIAIFNLVLPTIILLVLPKYSEGIIPAQIFIWGMYFYTMTGFFTNTIVSVDKQKIIPVLLFISSTINLVFCILLLKAGMGIIGISIATAFAYICYSILTVIMTNKYYKIEYYKSIVLKYYAPVIYTIIIYSILAFTNIFEDKYIDLIAKLFILSILSLPLLISGMNNFKVLLKNNRSLVQDK